MRQVSDRMVRRSCLKAAAFSAALLLCGCASDKPVGGGAQATVYNDWLYHHHHWYDDDFWIWADDHPDCCEDDDIGESLKTWYDGLDPADQQKVQDRVQDWMDEHGVTPGAGQSTRDLIAQTVSDRWAALTPAERQEWRDDRRARIEQRRAAGAQSALTAEQRAALADLDPEQRAALLESGQGASFDGASTRRDQRSISNHPAPRRTGMSAGGTRFHAARGGGRGGRRR